MYLTGIVVEGNRIGRTLGFPTANIHIDDPKVRDAVPSGVFACKVTLPDGSVHGGMLNVGVRPTIGVRTSPSASIEVHIFDYSGNLYGQTVSVEILQKIRDEQKFNGLEELKTQLEKDRSDILARLK